MKIKPTQEELAAAQMIEWPDSKLLTISEALEWIAEAREPTRSDEQEIASYCATFADCDVTPEDRRQTRRDAITRNELVRSERSKSVAQSIAVALANAVEAGTPVQFYTCGSTDPSTGKQRFRGCRYGTEGSEYQSGFGFF